MLIASHKMSSLIENFCENFIYIHFITLSLYFTSNEYTLTLPFLNPKISKCPFFVYFKHVIRDYYEKNVSITYDV